MQFQKLARLVDPITCIFTTLEFPNPPYYVPELKKIASLLVLNGSEQVWKTGNVGSRVPKFETMGREKFPRTGR